MRFIGNYKGFKLSANYGGWTVVGQLEKGGCMIIGEIHDTDAANLLVSVLNEKVRVFREEQAFAARLKTVA